MPRSPHRAREAGLARGEPTAASATPKHAQNGVDASSSSSSLHPRSDAKSKNHQQQQQGQQDHQHAVDLYQKGMEIAHNAATYEDHCRAIEHFSLAIAIRGDQARFFLARGNAFRAINELEHAARDYGAAIALDDRCALYYANRGACHRKLNQPVRALEDLTVAIEVDGRKGPHYLNRALVLQESGFYREAIVDFTKALDDGPSSSGAGAGAGMGIGIRLEYRALQGRGLCYRRVGNLPKCIDDLQAAIKLDARNSSGFSALALAYVESGDFDLAIEFLSRAIETNAANASYYSHRGICYYRKGDLFARQCLADVNRCIQLDGSDPQAYFYRGAVRLALALGLGTAASSGASQTAASPSKAPSSSPPSSNFNSPPIVPSAAVSLSAGGFLTPAEQLKAAYADIEMAWTLSATRPQYQTGMAMILQLKQRYDDAAALLHAVSECERENVLVKYHLALCCCVLRDHERALALLTDAIDLLPTEPLFVETRGQLLQELGCHTLAIRDFSAAILIRENDDRASDSRKSKSNNDTDPSQVSTAAAVNHYLRGESFLRLEEFQRALDDCSRSMELGYTDESALNARAMAFRGLGQLDRAIDDLNKCLAQSPSNDVFHFHHALCLIESGLHHDALSDLHASLQSHPGDARMLYLIGVCYYHDQEPRECLAFLERALQHEPAPNILPDLHYHMGVCHALCGQNMPAVEHFTAALQHSTSSLTDPLGRSSSVLAAQQLLYVHERAKALQLERYFEEAIDDFSLVIAHNPTNAHAHFRRGFAHKATGDFQAAARDFEIAKLLDPGSLALVVNYKEIRDTECVVLCAPGQEKLF